MRRADNKDKHHLLKTKATLEPWVGFLDYMTTPVQPHSLNAKLQSDEVKRLFQDIDGTHNDIIRNITEAFFSLHICWR